MALGLAMWGVALPSFLRAFTVGRLLWVDFIHVGAVIVMGYCWVPPRVIETR
jgi:hypothetical protein